MMGLFASIGIEKGKPFSPDARMKRILTDAANIGAVTARTLAFHMRDKDAYSTLTVRGGYPISAATSSWFRLGSATSTATSSSTFSPRA